MTQCLFGEHLQLRGYDAQLLVPEEENIPLKERVRRANKLSCQIGHPIQETTIISIHVNAAFPSHTESDGIVFYLSDAGRKAIIGLHVDGIVAYLNDAEPEPFR